VLVNHWDSINDLVVKEYQESEEQLSFFTCSKDSTLRLWNTYIGDSTLMSMMPEFGSKPVENDLKRIVNLESNQLGANGSFIGRSSLIQNDEENQGIKCLAYNQMRNILAVGDMMGNIRIYYLITDD
jgi:WD40 repeat protein